MDRSRRSGRAGSRPWSNCSARPSTWENRPADSSRRLGWKLREWGREPDRRRPGRAEADQDGRLDEGPRGRHLPADRAGPAGDGFPDRSGQGRPGRRHDRAGLLRHRCTGWTPASRCGPSRDIPTSSGRTIPTSRSRSCRQRRRCTSCPRAAGSASAWIPIPSRASMTPTSPVSSRRNRRPACASWCSSPST